MKGSSRTKQLFMFVDIHKLFRAYRQCFYYRMLFKSNAFFSVEGMLQNYFCKTKKLYSIINFKNFILFWVKIMILSLI